MATTHFVAKILLLDNDNHFLLLRRSKTHPRLAGFYDLPGGAIEDSEEPAEALIREVREETGIILGHDATRVLYATTSLINGRSFPTLLYVSRLSEHAPTVTISWEHDYYEWALMERLAEVEPQLAPTYREALDYIRQHNIIEDIAFLHHQQV